MAKTVPTIPFNTIMRIANMVSRGNVGFGFPPSMTVARIVTSMLMTAVVKINVP